MAPERTLIKTELLTPCGELWEGCYLKPALPPSAHKLCIGLSCFCPLLLSLKGHVDETKACLISKTLVGFTCFLIRNPNSLWQPCCSGQDFSFTDRGIMTIENRDINSRQTLRKKRQVTTLKSLGECQRGETGIVSINLGSFLRNRV